jgi:hypothetical protein
MCGVKKKEDSNVVTIKATIQNQKAHNIGSYACHIYGLNGHKMIDYPKFAKMRNMFQRKNVLTSYGKVVVDIKTHYICECSRCKWSYQKKNHKLTNVPRERTKEEQKYYKLGGGEIKENNGRHHTTIIKGTYYK